MFSRYLLPLFIMFLYLADASAINGDNPFGKTKSINIGKDIHWKIDTDAVQATKSRGDGKGSYYHLQFDNDNLTVHISTDALGNKPKQFNQLEVTDVQVDGKQSPLFKWCLSNQESHDRFLQQGLQVRKNLCSVDGETGSFMMRLNKDSLKSLQNARQLLIVLKPYRTPVELKYDISDFKTMQQALNSKPVQPVTAPVQKAEPEKANTVSKKARPCHTEPPAKYSKLKSITYNCDNAAEKKKAEKRMARLVNAEKEKEQKKAAEIEKQRKLAEQKKLRELEEKRKHEEQLKAEAAAIAASKAKQAELDIEVTQKMVKVCNKYWKNGEHRCYCQKYIEFAPAEIRANSTCQ